MHTISDMYNGICEVTDKSGNRIAVSGSVADLIEAGFITCRPVGTLFSEQLIIDYTSAKTMLESLGYADAAEAREAMFKKFG